MSMPSDSNPDVTEAMERTTRPSRPPRTSQLTGEQVGWVVAALVAFFGVTYLGPALASYGRQPPLKDRAARRARDTRDRAQKRARKAGARVRKSARRLGGGSFWH